MDDVSEEFVAYAAVRKAQPVSNIGRTEYKRAKCTRTRANAAAYNQRSITESQGISPEERWQAIAVMAYHLARARGFVGDAVKYWLAAEAKVDAELAIRQSAM
uniref:DUF2934 domain-containing protein n=1 Tax=Candidatus Kentrum sp. FM TaxID=2126340 RepID=A0A450S1E3_9GAMM|nr:MAG: Protein of unknown function (DUF2934) [Candidatus Kentron sp. FM]VFJ45463.1 MAG: Protein of unknown function (DUF2934) [Candidatus Kentron sp. FM]VFK06650.1 MAG: Protein of unknown function (DUF2934) [Candidatus Kentron sp. FM]